MIHKGIDALEREKIDILKKNAQYLLALICTKKWNVPKEIMFAKSIAERKKLRRGKSNEIER